MATAEFGSDALAALHPGANHHGVWLTVRLVPRLVDLVFLHDAAADAIRRKSDRDPRHQPLAPEIRMDAADPDRTARAGGVDAPFRASRPRHAPDVAGIGPLT